MDFAFILDPLPLLKAYKDTSISMMRALARRGHRVFALEQSDVYWRDGVTAARSRPLALHAERGLPWIVITHDPDDLAACADTVVTVDGGRIVGVADAPMPRQSLATA